MSRARRIGVLCALALGCLVAASFAAVTKSEAAPSARPAPPPANGCGLKGPIKHVVYLQFDNTHYARDNPSVASDLEQMPHLLSFLQSNGTLFTNDHTILISHTAGGIVSTQTGLYPDRHRLNVTNSYFYFGPVKNPTFNTAFKYWTDLVDDSAGVKDAPPNMVTGGDETTPPPLVPFQPA